MSVQGVEPHQPLEFWDPATGDVQEKLWLACSEQPRVEWRVDTDTGPNQSERRTAAGLFPLAGVGVSAPIAVVPASNITVKAKVAKVVFIELAGFV